MTETVTRIHEIVDPDHRTGRHIQRGPIFDAHVAEKTGAALANATYDRQCAPFDQGSIGSCTGNASAGALMTTPLFVATRAFTEVTAVEIYSEGTFFNGTPNDYYPPNDTGSSGPAVAQGLEVLGLVSSYTHAVDLQGAQEGLQTSPGIFGISWYTSFDTPLPTGECPLTPGATVRGGHEIQSWQLDMENQRVWFWQSWGATWGGLGNGQFWLSFSTLNSLFQEQADVTFFVGTQQVNPGPLTNPNAQPAAPRTLCQRIKSIF
jgi:hypothetical protein